MDLSEILREYGSVVDDPNIAGPDRDIENDFDNIAGQLSSSSLAGGLAEAFRSDQTPPFASMLGGLFGNSNGSQQATVLNTLLSVVGPMVMQQMMGGGSGGQRQPVQQESGLGGILGSIFGGGGAAPAASRGGGLEAILGSGALGGILQGMMSQGGLRQLTPQEAAQISPEEIQALAETAQQQEPGVIDQLSGFYAEHPTLVKTLGAGALAFALGKIAQSQRD
ncbi:hypothetical protein F183_A09420 [Bryobacterales bacterium F-183]|nr:hypothetical protein F183_A09420 [Bryobacterales bacterium F-183]